MRRKCRDCRLIQKLLAKIMRLQLSLNRIKEYTDPLKGEVAETVNRIASE